jgi:hypothetical protein
MLEFHNKMPKKIKYYFQLQKWKSDMLVNTALVAF